MTLSADIYRPAGGDAVPAVLLRTPYDRTDPALVSAIVADPVRLARAGYAVVVQDVRGRFGSGGTMRFFHQEHDDGYDAVEWVAAQPWCDGRVGVYGSSYHAMAAYQAVAAQPPHLRAAATLVGATDLSATTRPGGLFELGFLALYGLGQCVEAVRRAGLPPAEQAAVLHRIQAAAGTPGAAHDTVATLPVSAIDVLADQEFWPDWIDGGVASAPTLRERPDLVGVPLLQVVAFRDFMAPTMLELFAAVAERAGGPHVLVAGPWAHSGTYTGHVGSRTFPGTPGGVATWGPLLQAWFDRHLRGREVVHRFLGAEPVSFYVTGDDRWERAASWPPPAQPLTWRLGADARLGPSGAAGERTYRSDPADPFPTCGGASSGAALGPDGVQDRRRVEARADVLLWTSDLLTEPLRIAGPVTVTVEMTSTAPGFDVCATLVDVEPDGFAAGVSEGAVRVGTVVAGPVSVAVHHVALHHTAHTFRPGHRVRLEVAGANFPRLSRHLHTAQVPEHATEGVVAQQTVFGGELVLPTV